MFFAGLEPKIKTTSKRHLTRTSRYAMLISMISEMRIANNYTLVPPLRKLNQCIAFSLNNNIFTYNIISRCFPNGKGSAPAVTLRAEVVLNRQLRPYGRKNKACHWQPICQQQANYLEEQNMAKPSRPPKPTIDPKGAGYPSTTDKPSGKGRGNNTPSKGK